MAGIVVGAQLTSVTSGGVVGTNGANINDASAAAAAAQAAAQAASVPLAGHAGFSLLGKATTGSGNAADIPVGTDSVSGRIGSGNVGDIPMTAAGRAMAGAASATAQTALLDAVTSGAKGLAPASGGGTTNFLRADGSWAAPAGAGGTIIALTGDVAASGTGSVAATIQPGAVTNAKRANMAATTLSGNNTGAPAVPTDLTAAAVTAMLNVFTSLLQGLVPASGGGTAAFLRADGVWTAPPGAGSPLTDGDKGDVVVSGGGTSWIIDAAVVAFSKMQNIATQTLIGRQTAGSGSPESIGVTGGIEFDGSGNIRRSALTGDVVASAGSAGTVISNNAVTNGQLAQVPTGTIKGRTLAGTGNTTDLTFAALKTAIAISLTADVTGLLQAAQFPALTGDVTTLAGSLATTLANIPTHVPMAGDIISTAIAAPAAPAAGKVTIYTDSTSLVLSSKNNAGVVSHTVRSKAGVASNFLTSIGDDGTVGAAQPGFNDLTGSLQASQFPALTGDVTTPGGSFSTNFSLVAANTILANATGFSARPVATSVAATRTLLGLDASQHFDLLLSYGTGDGANADSVTPQSAGPGNWPFFLLPNTRNSDIPNNAYTAGNHDANLSTPAAVNEWRVTGAFSTVELSVEVAAVIGIGGGGSVVFILSKNGLIDASPVTVTITTTGFFSSGVISLGGFAFTGADRVGVRAQVLGGSVGAQLKATVTVHLTP